MKRVAVSLFAGFTLVVGLASAVVTEPAQASVPGDQATIKVSGSLANMTSTPQFGSPVSPPTPFSPSTNDYAIYCHSGVNLISLKFDDGVTPKTASVSLGENQAAVVQASNGQYWIRCLPHDFPVMQFSGTGSATEWYLTGLLSAAVNGSSSTYAMVLDGNGTPVWYQKAPGGAINVQATAPNTIAWMPENGGGVGVDPSVGYHLYNLATQTSQTLKAPILPTDFHELYPMANGHYMMIGTPTKAVAPPVSFGGKNYNSIVDCVIQEVTAQGSLVWSWRASNHVSTAESVHPTPIQENGGQTALDMFHCNSIDVNPTTGQVLVSMRDTDSVYQIERMNTSGALVQDGPIMWRLTGTGNATKSCGNGAPGLDHEPILEVQGDPLICFDAQHDARFQPNGDISLYDDQSYFGPPVGTCPASSTCYARGVEYAPHPGSSPPSATWVTQFPASPSGQTSFATGSFRRYDNNTDNLVNWGFRYECMTATATCQPGVSRSGFTEFDGNGNQVFAMNFPNGEIAYRTVEVPRGELDINLMRATAGLPRPTFPTVSWQPLGGSLTSKPAVASWSANRLDVFGRGGDGELWHRSWNGSFWSSWEPLGGALLAGTGPAVASWGPNRLDVIVTGLDHSVWHISWNGSFWSAWEPLGGYLTSGPGVSTWGPGRLDVVGTGGNQAVWHLPYQSAWLTWEDLGGVTFADPAIASPTPGQVHVFAMGTFHELADLWFDGTSWHPWVNLGGNLTGGPSATSLGSGLVDAVAVGSGGVPERLPFSGGAWWFWQPLGGATNLPPAIAPYNGGEEVVATGPDTTVWYGAISPAAG
jgi:hypothetical protein